MHFLHFQKSFTAVSLILVIEILSVQQKKRNCIFRSMTVWKFMETEKHFLLIQIRWGPYNFWWYNTVCGSLQCHALFCVSKSNDKFDRFIRFFYNGHWYYNHTIFLIPWHYVCLRSYWLKKTKGPMTLMVPLIFLDWIKDAAWQILKRLCAMSTKHSLSIVLQSHFNETYSISRSLLWL